MTVVTCPICRRKNELSELSKISDGDLFTCTLCNESFFIGPSNRTEYIQTRLVSDSDYPIVDHSQFNKLPKSKFDSAWIWFGTVSGLASLCLLMLYLYSPQINKLASLQSKQNPPLTNTPESSISQPPAENKPYVVLPESKVSQESESPRYDEPHPVNGTRLRPSRGPNGLGRFRIINDSAQDMVVRLKGSGTAEFSEDGTLVPNRNGTYRMVFIRAHQEYTLKGVPQGAYLLLGSQGSRWSTTDKKFVGEVSYFKADKIFTFHETSDERGTTYDVRTVKWHATFGNLNQSSISEAEFESD